MHDVVVDGDMPWIIMQLVTGTSLDRHLDVHGPLSVDRAADVATALLRALGAAHEAGVAHRDVKPANVMLTADGDILLTDFGIAIHQDDTALTATGAFIGSMEYIAPERASGQDGETTGDLSSLGVTLYQAVEGFSPFRRGTPAATLAAVLSDDPPSPQRAGRLLAPLITGLLEKDPDRRPTIDEALALALAAHGPSPKAGTRATASGGNGPGPAAPIRPGPAPQSGQGSTRPFLRRAVAFGVLGLLLAGVVYSSHRWIQSQYFVGANARHVAVYQGVNQSLAWMELSSVEVDHPEIELDLLPPHLRTQVESTIHPASLDEARAKVDELAVVASACKKMRQGRSGVGLSEKEQKVVTQCTWP